MVSKRPRHEFICGQCSKIYTRAASLKNHERIHTGERPHSCDECGDAFMTKDVLRSHKAVHLPFDSRICCSACSKTFTRLSSLRRHEKAFCPLLDKPSPTFSELEAPEDMVLDMRDYENFCAPFSHTFPSTGEALNEPHFHPSQIANAAPLDELNDEDIRNALISGEYIDYFHLGVLYRHQPLKIWWNAAELGHLQVLEFLCNEVPLDVNTTQAQTQQTALHIASRAGKYLAVRGLLQLGAEVEVRALDKSTPLFNAVLCQHTDTVKALLSHGADIDVLNDQGHSPLDLAIEGANWEILNALLGQMESPVSATKGRTLFHRAIRSSSESCAKLSVLLYHGVDITDTDDDGNTALHAAAQMQDFQSMEKILDNGNLVRAKNHQGRTALHCLFLDSKISSLYHWRRGGCDLGACLELLISHGIDINAVSNDGHTVLTDLVTGLARIMQRDVLEEEFFEGCKKTCELVRLLLRHNADPNIINKFGATALDLICQNFNKTINTLRQHSPTQWQRPRTVGPEQFTRAFLEIENTLKEFGALNARDSVLQSAPVLPGSVELPYRRTVMIR